MDSLRDAVGFAVSSDVGILGMRLTKTGLTSSLRRNDGLLGDTVDEAAGENEALVSKPPV
jgi:hypothetical protein